MGDGGRDAVVIGYNSRFASVVGAGALLLFLLLLVRALTHAGLLDGLLAAAFAVVGGRALVVLLDSAPLLVADSRGVRVRVAGEWCGLPWVSISDYQVIPRRFPWSDGRLLLELHHPSHVTESLSLTSRRQVARNQRRYGVPLVVPLGLMTAVSRNREARLLAQLDVLARGSRGAQV